MRRVIVKTLYEMDGGNGAVIHLILRTKIGLI